MISGFVLDSILKRAQEKGLVEINIVQLRDFARDAYGTVDDRPYGGGAGMVICVDVLKKSLSALTQSNPHPTQRRVVLTSARGSLFTQQKARELAQLDEIIIYAGHYEGFDDRFSECVDEELSLGDFILTGGELAAATICDAVVRLIPGVLKKETAVVEESFFTIPLSTLIENIDENPHLLQLQKKGVKTVQLLEYPQYTRPEEFEGKKVPSILLSGDPKKIKKWQLQKAFEITSVRRPDLLDKK